MSEEVWRNHDHIGDFVQADPFPGEPPIERTEVRIAFDETALYIGIRCFDRLPEKIFTTTMVRDGKPWDDDNVEIVIDPFHDRRNAYYYCVNAAGAMSDGRIFENGPVQMGWDGIWDAKTTIDELGWTAELKIPFKTLSFNPSISTWGFNIERTLSRANEESRWEAASLDAKIGSISRAGDLGGLEELSQGIGIDIKPYGILGLNRDITRLERIQSVDNAGADIFYRVTPNLLSSTTINTDFAETEVDVRQVNLTRFPLLFPEKRAFFLEEAGVFQFGLPSSGSTVLPFFSRRIGLVNGQTVPILMGEKLTGTIGRLELGVLDVVTRDSEIAPGENLFAARTKISLGKQSYIGGILTHGDPMGVGDSSLAGADLVLATTNFFGQGKNFDVGAYTLKTNNTEMEDRDYSHGFQVRYPNDLANVRYSWQEIGQNFEPKLGYVHRRGVRINSWHSRLGPRPRSRHIRQLYFDFNFSDYFSTTHRALESRNLGAMPVGVLLHGGQRFAYSVSRQTEQLFRPFEIHEGIEIPVGRHSFTRHQLSFQGPNNKPFSYNLTYDGGSFYTGHSDQLISGVTWRKSARINTAFEIQQYWVRLREGRFSTSLALIRLNCYFSPNLGVTNFVQYDTDSRNVALQSRLRWVISPGQEVFFVFGHEWQNSPVDRFETFRSDARAKLDCTLRF